MSAHEAPVRTQVRPVWRCALIAALAAQYIWVGLASSGVAVVVGVLGGVTILGAVALVLITRPRPAALVVLMIGALPLALLTWMSLVTPIVAAVCLGLGWPLGGQGLQLSATTETEPSRVA